MDRADFLKRTGLVLGAVALGRLPVASTQPEGLVVGQIVDIKTTAVPADEILRRYYLPAIREQLNSPSILFKEFE